MPSVHVHGNKPDSGPSYLAATTSRDEINETNPAWNVVLGWTLDESKFTSAVATKAALEKAVKAELPHYLYYSEP
ncbi:MAG: hypothetical protein ACXVB0_00145 [Mucilaginibacter sp.]